MIVPLALRRTTEPIRLNFVPELNLNDIEVLQIFYNVRFRCSREISKNVAKKLLYFMRY